MNILPKQFPNSPLHRFLIRCFSTAHYVPLIGLEIHTRLLTRSKLFSRSPYEFSAPPNTQIALLDAAVPGSMPLLNRRCVELAVRLALALQSRINLVSQFDRKHYFYTDSPAGYQITQYWKPIAEGGFLDYLWSNDKLAQSSEQLVATERVTDRLGQTYLRSRARIRRIQIEQDTGKSLHDEQHGRSYIDLNRSGVGLVELVTEPDFTHPMQASAFVSELSDLLVLLECSKANASQGDLRVDVNVSVGPSLDEQGPRTEVKNVNSVRAVGRAIQYEINRQIKVLQSRGSVVNETRSYDPVREITLPMRDKEVIQDYRYLPEPDLPLLRLSSTCSACSTETVSPPATSIFRPSERLCIQCARNALETLLQRKALDNFPYLIKQRLVLERAVPLERAHVLLGNSDLYALYERCRTVLIHRDCLSDFTGYQICQELTYWICGQITGMVRRGDLPQLPHPERIAEFVELSLLAKIYGTQAEELLVLVLTDQSLSNVSCSQLAEERGWLLINDPLIIQPRCEELLHNQPKLVKQFHGGKQKKVIKRLAQCLFSEEAYGAERFNPYVVEKILGRLLQEKSKN